MTVGLKMSTKKDNQDFEKLLEFHGLERNEFGNLVKADNFDNSKFMKRRVR